MVDFACPITQLFSLSTDKKHVQRYLEYHVAINYPIQLLVCVCVLCVV